MDLRFETKDQSTKMYRNLVIEVLSMPGVADTLAETGVRKALEISTSMSIIRSYADLELFISHYRVETHTSSMPEESFAPHTRKICR